MRHLQDTRPNPLCFTPLRPDTRMNLLRHAPSSSYTTRSLVSLQVTSLKINIKTLNPVSGSIVCNASTYILAKPSTAVTSQTMHSLFGMPPIAPLVRSRRHPAPTTCLICTSTRVAIANSRKLINQSKYNFKVIKIKLNNPTWSSLAHSSTNTARQWLLFCVADFPSACFRIPIKLRPSHLNSLCSCVYV